MKSNLMTFWVSLAISAHIVISIVQCAVDESKPDLSIFKLRHVDGRQFARKRANDPIKDYSTGAEFMFESLFVKDLQVRCISYGHLLKLIKQRAGSPEDGRRPIKQDVVEALAIVTDVDRAIYYDLFRHHQPDSLPKLFTEAIEQLEKVSGPLTRDAWLDLLQCATAYSLTSFQNEPKRAAAIENFEHFKAIPVDLDSWIAESKYETKVTRLYRKFEGDEPNAKLATIEELQEARATIESFDDEQMAQIRRKHQLKMGQINETYDTISDIWSTSSDTSTSDMSSDVMSDEDTSSVDLDDVANLAEGIQLQLIVPNRTSDDKYEYHPLWDTENEDEDNNDDKPQYHVPSPREEQSIRIRLTIMTFIKRRYQWAQTHASKSPPKLSMNSAIDFGTHWHDLRQLKLDPESHIGKMVFDFINNEENRKIAFELSRHVQNYRELVEELDNMEAVPKRKFKSMEEIEATYKRWLELLDGVADFFELADVARVLSLMKSKELKEFRTINQFINGW